MTTHRFRFGVAGIASSVGMADSDFVAQHQIGRRIIQLFDGDTNPLPRAITRRFFRTAHRRHVAQPQNLRRATLRAARCYNEERCDHHT